MSEDKDVSPPDRPCDRCRAGGRELAYSDILGMWLCPACLSLPLAVFLEQA